MKKIIPLLFSLFLVTPVFAAKVSDLVNIVGVRDNQLIGYGLVVGLNGSGDKTTSTFTMQSISNMLESVNVKIDPNDIQSKNVAFLNKNTSRVIDRITQLEKEAGEESL